MRNKGYLMVELMIAVLITSFLTIITGIKLKNYEGDDRIYMSEFLLCKAEAMAKKTTSVLKTGTSIKSRYPVYFNKNGSINQAQTIYLKSGRMIVSLGSGYYLYEK